MSSKLLRGTFILTLGTLISKVLGLFYVIPFDAIVGQKGTTLYQYSYVPYTIFISIATAGIPLAISKFISKYNALEEYAVGRKLFKSGLVVMLTTGIVSFLILYASAPLLADLIIRDNDQTTSKADVITVTRAVSFALIVVPFMSLIRGFFQGHQSMGPSAVSQVVEQIVRIVFLLAGAYVVLHIFHGEMATAVSLATFAAFIGAIGSLLVLFWYWYKRKPYLDELLLEDKGTADISLRDMYKEILLYAAPFVFVGIANPLFQFIDQITFNRAMVEIGLAKESDFAFSALNFYSHKLVIIPVSLATAFSLTLVPNITKSYIEQDFKGMYKMLNQTFQVLLFLTVPAVVGMSLLAEPIYTAFYGHDLSGTEVLRAYSPVAILFALYSVTAAIMQGINEQRFTILSLLVGLLIKLSLNIPLIKLMETKGAILATALGYGAAILINLVVIKIYAQYNYKLVWRRTLLIGIFSLLMFLGAGAVYQIFTLFLTTESVWESLIIILVCALVGLLIYSYLGLRSKLVNLLFGDKVDRLKKKLHLRL
ncbi:putative polysaccharide biosynthesis protein [Bacillus benzoevorans]|uniref:O-antigen/teichoic acid export membrane protein n=1 Tax=Bacillus benzoevorans TaxID=1456 RepID=A0A7X0HU59_9BACI|nr:polysaccharide biosynthesis protein [Bacillus benzoevorans]MBB6445760.1 O-antigen/teichoic acid export membrane protein [Bacillus benzoevorans]